jgi:hypothetical protein
MEVNLKPKGTALAVWSVYGRWVPHTRAFHDAALACASRTFRVAVPTYPYYTVRAER